MSYISRIIIAGNIALCSKYHSYRYKPEKVGRTIKHKPTSQQQVKINDRFAAQRDVAYAAANFKRGDKFVRLSYTYLDYPKSFEDADKRLMVFLKKIKRKFKNFMYIANTEVGTRGGIHHHLLIKSDFDLNILIEYWHDLYAGGFHVKDIYSDDLVQLASYFTKGSLDEQLCGGDKELYTELAREHSKVKQMKIHKSRNLIKPIISKNICASSTWNDYPRSHVIDGVVYEIKPGSWFTGVTSDGYPYSSYIMVRRSMSRDDLDILAERAKSMFVQCNGSFPRKVNDALSRMDPRHAELLRLKYISGLSYSDIAKHMVYSLRWIKRLFNISLESFCNIYYA